jgi:FkbM family methyltransferase
VIPLDLYRQVIENTDNPVVLEIGAAEGEDTKRYVEALLALKRPFQYLAFEPDTRNVWRLDNHPLKDHFAFFAVALGDRNGIVTFTPSNHPFSGSVRKPKGHLETWPFVVFGAPYEVTMQRLDDVANLCAISKVDWIWMDVQGSENLVIAGGLETLKRTRYLFSEFVDFESYEGQAIGIAGQQALLPGDWYIAQDFRQWEKGGDVLFKNRAFP